MQTKHIMDTKELRSVIFKHLDGIVTLPIISELFIKGILNDIDKNNQINLLDISAKYNGNAGYINVALRVLASQGFLKYQTKPEISIIKTNAFNYLLKYAPYLQPITDIISEVQKNNQKFRSEEHTSELQSRENLVCRLLLEKKKR